MNRHSAPFAFVSLLTIVAVWVPRDISAASGTSVVRDYVSNGDATLWALGFAWTWNAGVLTHHPFIDTSTAGQVAMPAFDPAKLYRVNVTFTNHLRGSVTVSLGSQSFPGYGANGSFTFRTTVAERDALLSFSPTIDYEGSISSISVVELGDELADSAVAAWSADGTLEAAPTHELVIDRLPVVSGHTYQVMFEVDDATGTMPGAKVDMGREEKLFSRNGQYSMDVTADQSGRLIFEPRHASAIYDGAINKISVREISSGPAIP